MPDMHTETPTVVEWIALNRLEPPETDVRNHRDRDELRSLAQSLERSGQIQAAKVYPKGYEDLDLDEEPSEAQLRDALEDVEVFRVVDGWSRREAARINNWDKLRCEIFPEPPEHKVIASLDANTERLDMDDYETMRSIKEMAEKEGLTHEQVGERLGKARSTISNWFAALEAYQPLLKAWSDPDTHIEYGHVAEIERLPNEELKEKVLRDALEYDRSVSMTRETARNTLKGWKRKQRDQRTKEERENDGKSARAQAKEEQPPEEAGEDRPCLLCGEHGSATIAVPVCKSDYGMLTRKKEQQEPLLASMQESPANDESDS